VLALLLLYARSIGVAEVEAPIAEDNPASWRVSELAGLRPAGRYTAHDGATMIRLPGHPDQRPKLPARRLNVPQHGHNYGVISS
jgi:RimJ/RimL family protein N-acetyltransferase